MFLQDEIDESWIFYTSQKGNLREWIFKPVNVGRYASLYLWRHAEFKLGMSGTIFDPSIMCRELGIHECDYMRVDCPFPSENRPIYFNPVCNLTAKTMNQELPVLREQIEHDLEKYPDQKVLIHTVSYMVRDYLMEALSCQDRLMTHESGTREAALAEFKSIDLPAVMLSPSFDRGVDLPKEDNVGAQMICKVPFLYLGDPQVKAKVNQPGGQSWYNLKAVQTMCQMTGRAVRSMDQKCDTYIYDRQFSRLKSQMRDIIPAWWLRAVQEVRDPIAKTGMLI
jgi:Rad3-related DNA helicase